MNVGAIITCRCQGCTAIQEECVWPAVWRRPDGRWGVRCLGCGDDINEWDRKLAIERWNDNQRRQRSRHDRKQVAARA